MDSAFLHIVIWRSELKNIFIVAVLSLVLTSTAHADDDDYKRMVSFIGLTLNSGALQEASKILARKNVTTYQSAYTHAKACYRDLQIDGRFEKSDICASYVMKRDGNLNILEQYVSEWLGLSKSHQTEPDVLAYFDKVEYTDTSINTMSFSDLDVKIDTGIRKSRKSPAEISEGILKLFGG